MNYIVPPGPTKSAISKGVVFSLFFLACILIQIGFGPGCSSLLRIFNEISFKETDQSD